MELTRTPASAAPLRQELRVADIDQAAFEVFRDVIEVSRHPLKGIGKFTIIHAPRQTARARCLVSIVPGRLHGAAPMNRKP
jgi:hypothetical protein